MFIKSRIYLDDEYVVMTRNYFLQYTQLEIPEFRDTLIQLMESVKKSIDERAQHKREYDSWKGVGHNQKKRIQAADQRMMNMLMMQISDPYMMKSQWLRYLSDHRPIMLRDSSHDYGPIPFRMYQYWFEIDGFEEMISKAWCECLIVEIIKDIQEAEKVDNLEAAQKAKIKWAIEGEENTKFYHGILNKKPNQLGIRGVLKDGMWIDNSVVVKKEFLEHFSTRFQQPHRIRPVINIDFPCTI
nr:RNA-directed DNA polymerase, eukaryota [Tanacetum cinerariifolium]